MSDMPNEIYVCGVGYKGKEGLSAVESADSFPHQTKYIRADLIPPIEGLRVALDVLGWKGGGLYPWDGTNAEVLIVTIKAAAAYLAASEGK